MAKPGYSSSGVLPVMVVAAQLPVIGWGVAMVADASPGMIAALIVAVGLGSGIFGLLAAHELIHCRSWALSALGMLTAVTYRHFRIAQLREHHRWAVTARDPGTARLGESAYAFLPRSIAAQLGIAHGGGGPGVPQRAPIAQPYLLCADLLIYTLVYASLAVAFGFRRLSSRPGRAWSRSLCLACSITSRITASRAGSARAAAETSRCPISIRGTPRGSSQTC